jgi:hypothetical protein
LHRVPARLVAVADQCIVPQLSSARRFNVPIEQLPRLLGINAIYRQLMIGRASAGRRCAVARPAVLMVPIHMRIRVKAIRPAHVCLARSNLTATTLGHRTTLTVIVPHHGAIFCTSSVEN